MARLSHPQYEELRKAAAWSTDRNTAAGAYHATVSDSAVREQGESVGKYRVKGPQAGTGTFRP